jgi:UDP:flavonoid glycosyltransferase YjiC (YdhE family)
MRVAMLTCGTRGDTQPMVVLGAELRRRGHDVVIAASPNTLDLPRACGFDALPLGPDSQQLMESDAGQRWLASGNVQAFTKELTKISSQHFENSMQEARAACAGADVVVAGILAEDIAEVYGEAEGAPLVSLHSAPVRATSAYAHPLVTGRSMIGPLNSLTGALFDMVWWKGVRDETRRAREDAGLPPVKASLARRRSGPNDLELQAYDALLVPELDWGPRRPLVGFLSLDDELRGAFGETGLDPELHAWLDAGDPPVLFGFGSMPVQDPAAVVAMITETSRALGVRALISAGWGRLEALETDNPAVRVVGAVDHGAVLPRCVAAVHHGGAGTLAASLEAGLPTVVCSVFADQPFWGARLVDAGVGAHLRFKDLDRVGLAKALRTVLSPEVRDAAAEPGPRLRSGQDAAGDAADRVEEVARHRV